MKYFLAIVITLSCLSSRAQAPEAIFKSANDLYSKEKYEQSIELYEQLIKTKHNNAEVYFNLGNAYYKTSDYAKAILNYERAKQINPGDEDIAYNLKLANMQIVDKIEPEPQVFYEKWFDSILSSAPTDSRAKMALILIYISTLLFIIYLFVRIITLKQIAFFSGLLILVFGIIILIVASKQNSYQNNHRSAIIFSTNEYVKSSPEENGKNLFMLHSGTKVEILDELKGWKKIRIANGNQGWIDAEAVEII